MQLITKTKFLLVFILFCFIAYISYAEEKTPIPENMLYSPYFKNSDYLNWDNIKRELNHKFRFIIGRRFDRDYILCHKFMRRMCRVIDRAADNSELNFSEINNDILFKNGSPINSIISPQPSLLMPVCNYHSYGNIASGCVIYCDVHGIDYESEFYKKNIRIFNSARPLIIASDIAELIIFMPTLIIFFIVFGIYYLYNKKRKSKILSEVEKF